LLRGWSGRGRSAAVVAVTLTGLLAAAVQVVAVAPASASTPAGAGEYVPVTQSRIVDSRVGQGLSAPVVAGTVSSFQVTGQGGIPTSGVSAVVLTVTTITPSQRAWGSVWAQGSPVPVAGLNVNAGVTTANTFITKVGATSGQVSITLDLGQMNVAVDVQGYYTDSTDTTPGDTFVPLSMTRVYDSRVSGGTLGAAATRTIQILGLGGIPSSGVAAVALNVTSTGPTAATFLEVWQGGTRPNPGSTVNVPAAGVNAGAMVQTGVDASGKISVFNSAGSTNVVVDVEGYYLGSASDAHAFYVPISQERILDTRSGLNTGGKTVPVAAGGVLSVPIRGVVGVSGGVAVPNAANVSAVMLTVSAVYPTAAGYLSVFPEGEQRAVSSIANYAAGSTNVINGTVIAKVGSDGKVSVYVAGASHTTVDVQGYFQSTPPPAPPAPGVSSSTFVSNGWAASGASDSVSMSMTSGTLPAVRQYKWALDDPTMATASLATVATDNATATPTVTPGDGWHTLYVQAVNTAANLSPVTTYPFGVGVAITGPGNATRVAKYVRLNGKASSAYASVSWNYRSSTTDSWVPVPVANVTNAGSGISTWPVATTTSGSTTTAPELVWDAASTLGKDGTVLLQACYTPTGGGAATCTVDAADPTITLDQTGAGSTDATTSLAGGTLDLVTGNLSLSATDASAGGASSDLTLSRTFNTLDATRTADAATGVASVFGPGWTTSLPVDSAGSHWTGLSDRGSTVAVTDSAGATTVFAKVAGGGYKPTGDDADSGLTLTAGTSGSFGPNSYTIADLDGNSTTVTPGATFTAAASTSAPHAYLVSTVSQPGSAQTTSYTYNASKEPTQILAPIPTGSTCTSTTLGSGTWTGSCKALFLTYGTSGVSTGRLTAVTLRTSDGSGAELDVDLACFAYDTNTRLAAAWDPRDGTAGSGSHPVACSSTQYLPTAYTYDASGRVATITPAGQAAWTLGYDGSNRVATLSRTHSASYNSGATETTSIVYGVSTAADGTHPNYRPDLTAATVATWGQGEAPVTGTAIFGPGTSASSTDLHPASVSYFNAEGRTVNTADYADYAGAGTLASGWHIDTTNYDSHGNTVSTLSAGNREEALDSPDLADPALGLPTNTVAAAAALSNVTIYAYDPTTGTGDVTDTFGPYHLTTLANGTVDPARQHTHTSYDTGTELAHPSGPLLHLPITITTGASLSAQAVATGETDVRTTTNAYALSTGDATGWTFRKPMKVTTDPAGLAISTITRYDAATGAVIETRQPMANATGTDAATTDTIYYTSAANATYPSCGGKAAWAGLLCETTPAAAPGVSGLPGLVTSQVTAYDYLTRPTTTIETVLDSAGTAQTRTTTTVYTNAPWGNDVASTTVTGGLGSAIPVASTTYSSTTGLPTVITAAATGTQAATTSTTGYDDFGRVISYTDNDQATGAQVNTTTTTYGNTTGRVASTTDAHGTTTYSYNDGGEFRDKATGMTVSGITGSFTARYDSDGNLVSQTWPNAVTQTRDYDETGANTTLTDAANGRTWIAEQVSANTQGQIVTDDYAGGSSYGGHRGYGYDAAGRLTQTNDTLSATSTPQCAVRTYTFDKDSNRTNNKSYTPAANGACQTTTTASNVSHSYDIADRLSNAGTDAGIAYDAFGRTTTLPSADTGNAGGNTTVGYYTNDLVRTQTQAGVTLTYALDASRRLAAHTSSAGGSWTNHYDDPSSDSPDWIAENSTASNYTRNITGMDGQLTATIDQSGTLTWDISNLHGDTIATATNTDLEPSAYYLTDEYGNTITGYTTPGRYGWLGGKQRAHDDLAGLTLMGVRLYTPALGRFVTTDPIVGGNPNAYTYPVDPVNSLDLDGRMCFSFSCLRNDIGHIVRNPAFQLAVTIGACTFGGAIGCAAANIGFGALSAYDRYRSGGGFTRGFFLGTALDVGLGLFKMRSMKYLFKRSWGLSSRAGGMLMRGTGRPPIGLVMRNGGGRILARNTAIGAGSAVAGYWGHRAVDRW
jgi:RHS repeat-associated protein